MSSDNSPISPAVSQERDATRSSIVFYAAGAFPGALGNNAFNLLNTLTIVALGMNPIVIGFIFAIKLAWDAVTDPVMAYVSDNSRSRWGRRKPFILIGGVGFMLTLIATYSFFPRDESLRTNASFVAQSTATSNADAEGEANPAPTPAPRAPHALAAFTSGFTAFFSQENAYHRTVAIYMLISSLIFTVFTTVYLVPYTALGMELCASYDGRTRVYVYQAALNKAIGLLQPWFVPFCFLPMFYTVIDGLFWFSVFVAVIGIPCLIGLLTKTHEHAAVPVSKGFKGPGLFRSILLTLQNIHFVRVVGLFIFISLTNGIFSQFAMMLNIYWVFSGDALAGTTLAGYAGTLATLLAFAALPLVNWACRVLGKDRALRYAVIWMSIGTMLNFFLVTPAAPYLQLILPFFFSVGISSVYTILPTMIADVTDVDELRNGTRREGMFGAVGGFLMKTMFTLQPVLAGVALVVAGFDASAGAAQTPESIMNMRILFSFVPGILLLLSLLLLWRYPLTRAKLEEIKAELTRRREAAASEA